ncbi:MAG: Thermostable carboxypeptidase 1 [Chlamydiae bacterium]|nr:Thermostable carboxypeptidase 1 [Chlamydiota bacterium]
MTKASYDTLIECGKKAALYQAISMHLGWDQETYMPDKAIGIRSEELQLLAHHIHEEKTSKRFANALDALIDLETGILKTQELTSEQQAAVREWRRDYVRAVKLPSSFVRKLSQATSEGQHGWVDAKERGDFKAFLPHLKKLLALVREKAEILGYDDHPYDALIDEYEPGTRTAEVTALLGRLRIPLTALVKAIGAKKEPETKFLHKNYPHAKQLEFGRMLLKKMGFDPSFCRLDETAHPMCLTVHPTDARLTTRVFPNNPLINILSVIHEGGHGLYHIGLPEEQFGNPLGEPASYGIDESQSRMWETRIGRGLPFWEQFYPQLQAYYPDQLGTTSLDAFIHAINIVSPTLIRTDADEVTYNLHIMVRFELEKALIEGTLSPEELPEAWNSAMRDLLGIVPKGDQEGCLQDIHWASGAFGYFPTYTLGNLYCAQFFETFAQEHPEWENRIKKGELAFITQWFGEKIYRHGRRYLPEELCENITGKPLSEKPFLDYLHGKYGALYKL